MIAKLITCTVRPKTRCAFHKAQCMWHDLNNIDGFVAQLGGWSIETPETAQIVALWSSKTAYDAFMTRDHDRIVTASGQAETYESCHTALFDLAWPQVNSPTGMKRRIHSTASLQIFDYELQPTRLREILDGLTEARQTDAPGEIDRLLLRPQDDDNGLLEFFFCSNAGVSEAPPANRLIADSDVEAARKDTVRVENAWRVVGDAMTHNSP